MSQTKSIELPSDFNLEKLKKLTPKWKRAKKGATWPKEVRLAREWLLKKYPLGVPPPKKLITSFMVNKYEGRVIWLGINNHRKPYLVMSKAFIGSPLYWEFGEGEFNPWCYFTGILVSERIADSMLRGFAKLHEIYENCSEDRWKGIVVHQIGLGASIGPHRAMSIRFSVDQFVSSYTYKAHIWQVKTTQNGGYTFVPTKKIFTWKRERAARVYWGVSRGINKLKTLYQAYLDYKAVKQEQQNAALYDELIDEAYSYSDEYLQLEAMTSGNLQEYRPGRGPRAQDALAEEAGEVLPDPDGTGDGGPA